MSGLTGKGATSIKKQEVRESRIPAIGFNKIRFLHKMVEGATSISLSALTAPSVSEAPQYSAPNLSQLTAVNLAQFPDNLELVSSIRGRLIRSMAYDIAGASTITLRYSAEENEIIEGKIDPVAVTGNTMVDAKPIVATGSLLATTTDFNVGEPFEVGKYPLTQHGSVIVFLDNQLMLRNTGNQPPGMAVEGDYYEVHAGAGLGTIIRFNTPDLVLDRNVSVISVAALAERPNGSMMAFIESVSGKVDSMIPTLAALASVAESTFGGVSNVDLKAFGDSVLALKQRLDNVVYNNNDYVEYSGALKTGNRLLPQVSQSNLGQGAFDITTLVSAGEWKTVKDGWYSFSGKIQTAGGTTSITRNNSTAVNGASTDVLASIVPVTNQEFQINWSGYLPANTVISFNTTGTVANNTTQMYFASYLGTKSPTTI